MKKQSVSLILTLALCAILALPALAVEGISLDKTVYIPGESITVTYSGVTAAEVSNRCWIGVARADAAPESYLSWGYVRQGSGTLSFEAPSNPGDYELRFFNAFLASAVSLAAEKTVPFTVSTEATADGVWLSLDRRTYAPKDTITASYSGVSRALANNRAWIGIAKAGAAPEGYLSFAYVKRGSGTLTFEAPVEAGDYELRFYDKLLANSESLVSGKTVPFTVANADVAIVLNRTSYTAGEPIVVTYAGIPARDIEDQAWIALAKAGSAANRYFTCDYLRQESGTVTLTCPAEPGEYELRYYRGFLANAQNLSSGKTVPFTVVPTASEAQPVAEETEPSAAANQAPGVSVNGRAVVWSGAEPFIDRNGRTMVPLRAVANALGLEVSWDGEAREASFSDGARSIVFPIDSSSARTDAGDVIRMDTAAVIVKNSTYAPVRYLAEFFGFSVGWDAAERTVSITGG